jgi:hypothetical protein
VSERLEYGPTWTTRFPTEINLLHAMDVEAESRFVKDTVMAGYSFDNIRGGRNNGPKT